MSRASRHRTVIAGGGLAAQRCAETLRRLGYEGAVTMVCAEPHAPYDRPPLSKELLSGDRSVASLGYRPAEWYQRQAVELELGVRASGLRIDERRVLLSDGSALRFDRLLIATGGRPRRLPMLEPYENVSVLRTVDDAVALRGVLAGRPRLAVLGAGFVGQEVAATARGLGCPVTMIEAAPSPLAGLLGPAMGDWFTRLHRAEGVEVHTGCTLERVVGNGSVRLLVLSNGATLEVDHVVVGVGLEPDVAWLAGGGLNGGTGIPVDEHGRTRLERVFAAGDCAATFDRAMGAHVPGSHWEAAGRQAVRAARAMLGLDPGPAPLTSFWTDQYGLRIQYLGHARLADAVQIDGDPTGRDFAATFNRDGRPVAALLVGRPRALPAFRDLIEKGKP